MISISVILAVAYGQGNVDEKYIKRGPIMVDQPINVAIFGAPPSAFIECKAKGNPNPIYSWTRDGGEAVTSKVDNRYITRILIIKSYKHNDLKKKDLS